MAVVSDGLAVSLEIGHFQILNALSLNKQIFRFRK